MSAFRQLFEANFDSAKALFSKEDSGQSRRDVIKSLVLSGCQQAGIRYAPILLQRKRALHRGTWTPSDQFVAALSRTTEEASADGDACSKCGGSGYVYVLGGTSATLCSCEGWKKQLARPA